MALLAAPAVELSPEERSLFKDAQLVVSDQGGDSVDASISAPMIGAASTNGETGSNSVVSTNLLATNMPSVKSTESNAQTPLPWQGKFKELLSQAKEQFDRQDYLQAENTFQEALKLSPNDYFVLSNYGVVEFQLGKMKEAEEVLKKATDQSTDNSFALTTLGIVYYRQHRPQDAEQVLRKALAINDNDFTAHNYLGIVLAASGKGKAGESELMKAVELNPSYADAHFNLAVIYATGKPPSKMLAKKHYQKALELGSPPDASLDRMLQ
jgi:Flp pilus assembly protein TadD